MSDISSDCSVYFGTTTCSSTSFEDLPCEEAISHQSIQTPGIHESEVSQSELPHEQETRYVLQPYPSLKAQKLKTNDYSIPWIADPLSQWTTEKEDTILKPFTYSTSHPGKDVRSRIINAFNKWLNVPQCYLDVINRAVSLLHESSLLIDDIQDSSETRRGFPAAYQVFGVAQTLNSANYIYFVAQQELQQLQKPEAVQIFVEEIKNLHRGQGTDLFWRDTCTCPTEDDYLEMVANKTGGLFRLAIRLMQIKSSTCNTDYGSLVTLMGLIFQIRDDYMNLVSAEYSAAKGFCEDLTEGKFSFPVIHCINTEPDDTQLINILKLRTSDLALKIKALERMKSTGSLAYTRDVIENLVIRATRLAQDLDGGRNQAGEILFLLDRMRVL